MEVEAAVGLAVQAKQGKPLVEAHEESHNDHGDEDAPNGQAAVAVAVRQRIALVGAKVRHLQTVGVRKIAARVHSR